MGKIVVLEKKLGTNFGILYIYLNMTICIQPVFNIERIFEYFSNFSIVIYHEAAIAKVSINKYTITYK